MKKARDNDNMPTEVDISNALRGRYANRIPHGATTIFLEPDVAEESPNSNAVNAAIRTFLQSVMQTADAGR